METVPLWGFTQLPARCLSLCHFARDIRPSTFGCLDTCIKTLLGEGVQEPYQQAVSGYLFLTDTALTKDE
jgi:hypothetical protein